MSYVELRKIFFWIIINWENVHWFAAHSIFFVLQLEQVDVLLEIGD